LRAVAGGIVPLTNLKNCGHLNCKTHGTRPVTGDTDLSIGQGVGNFKICCVVSIARKTGRWHEHRKYKHPPKSKSNRDTDPRTVHGALPNQNPRPAPPPCVVDRHGLPILAVARQRACPA